jgi:CHASE3 domain sensor protein
VVADPSRNADRISNLRTDLDDMRGTLREEIQTAKKTAARWGFRVFMAHLGVGGTIVAGLVLALLT